MAHNIDMSNNRENIAFLGKREDVWHRLGQEMPEGQGIDAWAAAAGLNYEIIKLASYAKNPDGSMQEVPNRRFLARNDTLGIVGFAAPSFKVDGVQPKKLLEWFQNYVLVDDHFQLDVAGALKGGAIVWATAVYNGYIDIMGEAHKPRLLMTTAYDSTMATINKATMTRVVCNNTLDAAMWGDTKAVVRTYHSQTFNPEVVAQELADIIAGFDSYKKMAESLARVRMSKGQVDQLFKTLLNVDPEKEMSKRTQNIIESLWGAYTKTVDEGTPKETAWAVLNSVTRYVDNDRSTKGATKAGSVDNARFLSANFGSGRSMKTQAVQILTALAV